MTLDIERHEHRLDGKFLELFDNLRFALPRPLALSVFGQRFDVRALRFDPRLGVGITVEVDDSHVSSIFTRPTNLLSNS